MIKKEENDIRIFDFDNSRITFLKNSKRQIMVNATEMAKPFNKNTKDWLRNSSTKQFIDALLRERRLLHSSDLLQVTYGNNGGTWMHEDLAIEFAKWLDPRFGIWCNDRIKELVAIGMTATPEKLEEILNNPDLLIGLATELKTERARRTAAEQASQILKKDNYYKTRIINGLTHKISLADMRQRIVQIIQKRGVFDIKKSWRVLYDEFDRKFHIRVCSRMNHCNYAGNRLDFIEKELNMLPQLYELTCKLFESECRTLINDWGRFAKRAEMTRQLKTTK